MTETVKTLATEIQTTVDRLVQQFAEAGIKKVRMTLLASQKEALLSHLNREGRGSGSAKQIDTTAQNS